MFDENFSFDAPRSPSLDSNNTSLTREPSRSVSPCSAAGSAPLLQFSVTDLAAQFSNQRIQRRAQICYDSCESYANNDDEAGWQIEPALSDADFQPIARSRTFPQRPHSPSQRQRRQASALLLCSSSHHRDIAELVSRMVKANDQCTVTSSDFSSSNQADQDEYESSEDVQRTRRSSIAVQKRTDHRRSSEIKTSSGCVSKTNRFRREKC